MTKKKAATIPETTPAELRVEIRRLEKANATLEGRVILAESGAMSMRSSLDDALEELAASKKVETIRQLRRTVHRLANGKGYTLHD